MKLNAKKATIYSSTHCRACGTINISKYVNNFLSRNTITLIFSSLVSEFDKTSKSEKMGRGRGRWGIGSAAEGVTDRRMDEQTDAQTDSGRAETNMPPATSSELGAKPCINVEVMALTSSIYYHLII